MDNDSKYNYIPLPKPTLITEQVWPEDQLPLVTTRTITYMHEPFIRECIEGILMQKTTFPVEVVIHDDASTDKTAEIVREYETKYPRLIKAIYQEKNQYSKPGRGTLRTDIYNATRGKYIALCEGDDYWTDPLKLQKQVIFLENNQEYVICAHKTKLYKNGKLEADTRFENVPNEYNQIDFVETNRIRTLSTVYRNISNLKIKPFHNNIFLGDHYLWLYLTEYGKVYLMDDVMGVYRMHPGSIWSGENKLIKMEKSVLHYEALILCFKHNVLIKRELKQKFVLMCIKSSIRSIFRFRVKKSLWYFLKSFRFGLNKRHLTFIKHIV